MIPVDVTGVFLPSFAQVFSSARMMKASITIGSKLMEHPTENGSTRTDFRIVLPVEITLGIILDTADYKQVYAQIFNIFNVGESLTVQTKVASYRNMMIENMPHEESPDYFDTIVINLKLKEVIVIDTQYVPLPARAVKNKTKQSTKNKGQQSPKLLNPAQEKQAEKIKASIIAARLFH